MLPSRWPRWLVIPIALLMVGVTIVIGLVLGDASAAIAPKVEPTPTLVMLPYAAPFSDGCVECHTAKERLAETPRDAQELERLYIAFDETMSLHGRLGCVTCHQGNGETQEVEAAHVDLIPDPTTVDEAKVRCLTCHHRLPTDVPEHFMLTPHTQVLMANHGEDIWSCSNCHLAVAHDERPFDSHERQRQFCIDCHEAQGLPSNRLACSGCHVGPHDVSGSLDCDICHVSTELWSQTQLAIHPLPLNGKHAEVHCFDCHTKPDFRTILNFTCADCHTKPHEYGGQNCMQCHFDDRPWNQVRELRYIEDFRHPAEWQKHMDVHSQVSCRGCHFQGYSGLSTDCESCHTSVPES